MRGAPRGHRWATRIGGPFAVEALQLDTLMCMGLLDDAIREHLDLKRARGDDPAEIERMEREALGPVRREPTIGSPRGEALEERPPVTYEHGYDDDVVELEELQDLGYHDSTAPHPRHVEHEPRHAQAEPHIEPEYSRFAEEQPEPEQPRRRFLRRNRDHSPREPSRLEGGFHGDEPTFDQHELLPHHEAFEHDDPLEQHDALEHHDALDYDGPPEQLGEAGDDEVPGQAGPPHLRFDQPPKRPRFTAEPPSTQPVGDGEAFSPVPVDEPEDHVEPQETTEFDVERHIAETRHLPDEDAQTRVHQAVPQERPAVDERPADDGHADDEAHADEDVLEETPEFLQDTPEHDRLWFEQRPPKDFDFDG
jgi:hypothetical protein